MPRARNTDPATSHAAARSVQGERKSQRAVWAVMRRHGDLTDEELVAAYEADVAAHQGISRYEKLPRQSPSGIRTRRSELVEQGWVVDSGLRKPLASGRRAIVWRSLGYFERQDRLGGSPAPAPVRQTLSNPPEDSGPAQLPGFDDG